VRDYVSPLEVLDLPVTPPPMRFAGTSMTPWPDSAEWLETSFCIIHLHSRWPHKSWPIDRWEMLIASLLEFVPQIVLSCGPTNQEIEENKRLCAKFGNRIVSTGGRASWSQLAWLLKRAAFFVGVDTAAMHLAAACECPSVALFGPSPIHEYYPWKTKSWVIRPQNWLNENEVEAIPGDKLMGEIPVNRVLTACREASAAK